MDKETESRSELMSFLQTNSSKTKQSNTGNYCFQAKIVYSHQGFVEDYSTEVRVGLTFPSEGKVSLKEENGLSADSMHLDFEPRYQTMNYNRDSNILVIDGDSSKMGKYKVTVSTL